MIKFVHPVAGVIAFLTIICFWSATVISEMLGDPALILIVKQSIIWGLVLLIPAMAIAGASGTHRGGGRTGGLLTRKKKRMPFIAFNGLVILVPSAFFLVSKAQAGAFDTSFVAVQILELVAGGTNILLLWLNILDGFKMSGRLSKSRRTNGLATSD